MRTGDLQSRVSEDISQMVAPIQYSLSQFLSNAITLVGGVAMCFLTSWRLSSTSMGLEPQPRSG